MLTLIDRSRDDVRERLETVAQPTKPSGYDDHPLMIWTCLSPCSTPASPRKKQGCIYPFRFNSRSLTSLHVRDSGVPGPRGQSREVGTEIVTRMIGTRSFIAAPMTAASGSRRGDASLWGIGGSQSWSCPPERPSADEVGRWQVRNSYNGEACNVEQLRRELGRPGGGFGDTIDVDQKAR